MACIERLAAARNATTLVLGRDPADAPELKPLVEKGLVVHGASKMPWRDFLKEVEAVSARGGARLRFLRPKPQPQTLKTNPNPKTPTPTPSRT